MRIFGSAVSAEVSERLWMHSTPKSRATSCTANAPADDSQSKIISQPSLVTNSRAIRADSSALPLESRITISILRPPKPPAALNFSTSIITALRAEVPSCATRPERIVPMPTLIGLSCARLIIGKPNAAAPPMAAADCNTRRRFLLMFKSCFAIVFLLNPTDKFSARDVHVCRDPLRFAIRWNACRY